MSSSVTELDGILQSMLELKAPGVTQAKISTVTSLCNSNVQSETVLIQKVYTHFKKTPGTHKLGVLYVVDSVTRQWLDQARKAGQSLGPAAADGSFAAGVNHVTELLPSFMTDILNACPDEQKVKIRKLIDIWERGNTFPTAMLSSFKERLNAPSSSAMMTTTTPNGTPPQDYSLLTAQAMKAVAPKPDTASILANLQNLAKLAQQQNPGNGAQGNANNVSFPPPFAHNLPQSVNPSGALPQAGVNVPPTNSGVFSFPGMTPVPPAMPLNVSGGQHMQTAAAPMVPQNIQVTPELTQQLQLLQMLQAQGVPQEQWATLLPILIASMAGGAANANANPLVPNPAAYGTFGREDISRERSGYGYNNMPSSPGRYRKGRSRSRSPTGWDRRRESTPPHRRNSPVYGEYGSGRNDYGRGGARGGGGNGGRSGNSGYRQRSPDRFRRSPSPRRQEQSLPAPGPKWMESDPSIGDGMIKVLSRTLFVGGVTSSEDDLRKIFIAFGRVQTCIVNVDKRHAFVKMITRDEAMRAKEGMEHFKSPEMQLRTRWGVGFGPRDCSDYQTGISIIPIDRLTDADRKWMLTAEYGGTGGKSIESGLVVEEPDIEIGAGVSSKAISRRMQTDKGGQQGPRSTRDPPAGGSRFRQPEKRDSHQSSGDRDNSAVGVAPAVPGFGFQYSAAGLTLPNGFVLPAGFILPGQISTQPPPPGAS